MELKIDSAFEKLIPALSVDEVLNLEQSLKSEGCRDAIVTWNGTIIDGHNRYAICNKHNLPFQTREMNFDNKTDAEIWMIKNQRGRRNASTYVMVGLGLKLEELLKKKGKENESNAAKQNIERRQAEELNNFVNQGLQNSANPDLDSRVNQSIAAPIKKEIEKINTREGVAKFANTSHDTVNKVKEIKNFAPTEVKNDLEKKIGSCDISINQAHKVVKMVKNDENAGDILRRALEKVEDKPKISLEEAVKETKHEIDLEVKEKKAEEILITDIKPEAKTETKKSTFNFTNDNIEWAKWTWNPVTGCKFGCPYCYARDIANRFNTSGFEPTFHENRLNAPINTVVPKEATTGIGFRNVFVCSMADLFGDWVPNEWIQKVMKTVRENPQWNYLFLTKNPTRLINIDFPENAWIGTTVDVQKRVEPAITAFRQVKATVKFLSCEPLQERLEFNDMSMFDWIIIGGRSKSSGMPAFQPDWSWVTDLEKQARKDNLKVYFKPNLEVRPKEYPQK